MLKIWCQMHFFTYWEKISLQKKIQSAFKNGKLPSWQRGYLTEPTQQ